MESNHLAARVQRAIQAHPRWAAVLAPIALITSLLTAAEAGLLEDFGLAIGADFLVALLLTLFLGIKSILDFSQTGPEIKVEVLRNFRFYTLFAFLRLCLWALLLSLLMGGIGILVYVMLLDLVGLSIQLSGAVVASGLGVIGISFLQFVRHLLLLPGSLCASLNYRPSRLYSLWQRLTPRRLHILLGVTAGLFGLLLLASSAKLLWMGQTLQLLALWGIVLFYASALTWALWEPPAPVVQGRAGSRPNILMIGSDTLRSDRLGAAGYCRALTPTIDRLAAEGISFSECFVPCARTAPSLVSLLTGTWPHRHGIRDNFVADNETSLLLEALPQTLKRHGYLTAAVSDWSGSDLGKFPFGFDVKDLPKDQWNLKYLIRQGPKDIRLFLSLFTHNRFGKTLLPELYYLAGVPLTRQVGRGGRRALSALAAAEQPFFLNIFCAATHPPFGSDYPYYTLYSDPTYQGESKFVMARVTDPFEIIRRQGEAKTEFDLDQIIHLYDGCVKSFDDEVARLLEHLDACGLAQDTIVVIYSDHGMEFFEHDTWGQGNSAIGDFSPRVPLVINDPRRKPVGNVDQVVRSIDIAPTLLELAGIDAPEHAMDGVSLLSCMEESGRNLGLTAYNETGIWLTTLPGMPEGHLRYPDLFHLLTIPDKRSGTMAIDPEYRDLIIRAKDRMVRYDRWKLVYQPLIDRPLLLLFDVVKDPQCRDNTLLEHPDVAQRLRTILFRWLRQERTGKKTSEDLLPGITASRLETVSVIIPSHNRPALLREAIASVVAQSYKNWEIVVVDDGSEPPVDAAEYSHTLGARFKLIRNETPKRQPTARDQGVQVSSGDLVIHLDDDDLLAPNALETALETFRRHPSLDLVFINVEGFGERAGSFAANQKSAMDSVLKLCRTEQIDADLLHFTGGLFPALLSSVPMAFQRSMEKRAVWDATSRLRREAYKLRRGVHDDAAAMRCLVPPLRESEWAMYAAIGHNTALLTEPLYLQRCDAQGYFSIDEKRENAVISKVDIMETLLRAAKRLPEIQPWHSHINQSMSLKYFEQAYYYFYTGRRRKAYPALTKALRLSADPSFFRFGIRMLLPKGESKI